MIGSSSKPAASSGPSGDMKSSKTSRGSVAWTLISPCVELGVSAVAGLTALLMAVSRGLRNQWVGTDVRGQAGGGAAETVGDFSV